MSKTRKTIRMPKADLKLVLSALRNPDNPQGRDFLFDGNGYCCLGAMQCAKTGGFVESAGSNPAGGQFWVGVPSSNWLRSVGWTFKGEDYEEVNNPYLPTLGSSAAHANDALGKSFAEIADAIEACTETY